MKRDKVFFPLVVLLIILTFVCFLDSVHAQDYPAVSVEKKIINSVIITELDIPAEYELKIRNNQLSGDNFEIYSLLDVIMTPLGTFYIEPSTTKTVKTTLMPRTKETGKFGITYFIKGKTAGAEKVYEDTFVIDVKPFSDVVKITIPKNLDRESKTLKFKISNPEKINLGKGKVSIESDFFDLEKEIYLSAGKSQEIELDLKDLSLLDAGPYVLEFRFDMENYGELIATRKINLIEVVKITESDFKRTGILSYTRNIIKKNEGNVNQHVRVELSQFVFERIFSRYNLMPDESYFTGLNFVTIWQKELQTGETLDIKATIDYTIPVLILIALIVAFIIVQITSRPRIILRKKILKVKTTSGEFALKIVLIAKNIGSVVENVRIIDRIPIAAKIHEKFGAIKPDKVENGKLEWKFEKLMPGEEHVLSYVVYSKVVFLGKINIPKAVAHYTDIKGKQRTAYSTKLSVVHELETVER